MARTGWILGILGLGGFAAIVAVGASGGFDDDKRSVTDLDEGLCVDVPGGDAIAVATLDEVDCDQPHDAEVFFNGELNSDRDRDYPGETQVRTEISEICVGDPWTDYVGTTYDESADLDLYTVYPQQVGWRATRGGYTCLVVDIDGGQLTGSVEDAD